MGKLRKWMALLFVSVLCACGGGGGGSSSSSSTSSGVSGTYTASAAAGEVLNYTVDTNALTYSYTITYSAYNLAGHTGSGTLTKNSDGSYTPSESPTSKVYALPNGLLVGAVKLNIQGHDEIVPILGVQNPVSTLSALAGTYNYISESCTQAYGVPSKNGCSTNYGTLKITAAGAYYQCSQANITTSATCYNTNGSQGTLTALGNGLFKYAKSGTTSVSYVLAFLASNGETVVIGDLNDSTYYGYGQFVGSTQPASNLTNAQWASAANGAWVYHDIYSDASNPAVATVRSSVHQITTSGATGSWTDPNNSSGTMQVNLPWAGFVTTSVGQSAEGVSILAGTGVYVWRSNNANVYEYQVGMRQ